MKFLYYTSLEESKSGIQQKTLSSSHLCSKVAIWLNDYRKASFELGVKLIQDRRFPLIWKFYATIRKNEAKIQ